MANEICGVGGCSRPAKSDVTGWPDHKETVHNYFHVSPCPYCDSENHCRVDCESSKETDRILDEIFGENSGLKGE